LGVGALEKRGWKSHSPNGLYMAIIRHVVLTMLNNARQHFKKGLSIKGLRKKAGWTNFNLRLIFQQNF